MAVALALPGVDAVSRRSFNEISKGLKTGNSKVGSTNESRAKKSISAAVQCESAALAGVYPKWQTTYMTAGTHTSCVPRLGCTFAFAPFLPRLPALDALVPHACTTVLHLPNPLNR